MYNHIEPHTNESPFDTIKSTHPDGTEYWSARNLMPMLGYVDKWQNFEAAIKRAMSTANQQGMDVEESFTFVSEATGGRPRTDVRLTRQAIDLIVESADQSKPAVIALRLRIPVSQVKVPAAPDEQTYFIEAPAAGMVKIGISQAPQRRLSALQVGSPTPLRLIGTIPGGREVEQELHGKFRDFHSHGEWFHMSPEIENYITGNVVGKELAYA